MQRGELRNLRDTRDRKMEIVDMKMDNVEFLRAGKDLFEHHIVVRKLIDAVGI
jgi:hypothetical protein